MVLYKEAGVELIQARGQEGRFQYEDSNVRLGVFNEGDAWYIGVHQSSGGLVARLSLEDAKTMKEAHDMLRFGFFLQLDESNKPLVERLQDLELLRIPSLVESNN